MDEATFRPVSEIRVFMWRLRPFTVDFAEGYWTDLERYRREGFSHFILVDDLDLEYWKDTRGV